MLWNCHQEIYLGQQRAFNLLTLVYLTARKEAVRYLLGTLQSNKIV